MQCVARHHAKDVSKFKRFCFVNHVFLLFFYFIYLCLGHLEFLLWFCSFMVSCKDHMHILLVSVFDTCEERFYALKVDDTCVLTFVLVFLCV